MGALNRVRQAAGNAVRNAQRAVDNVQRNVGNTVNNVQRNVNNTVNNVQRNVNNTVDNVQRNVNRTVDNVQRNVNNTVNNVQRNVNRTVDNVQRNVNTAVDNVQRNVRNPAINNAVDSFQSNANRSVDSTQRNANRSVDSTQRNVNTSVDSTQRNVNTSVDNTQRNVNRSVDSTQRNVNSAVDNTQRNVSTAVDNTQRNVENTLRATADAAGGALNTAREVRANALSTVNQATRQVDEGFNNLVVNGYNGARQLQQSDNPALRALGNTHVAVTDAVSNANRTVDNAVRHWQDVGGLPGAAGEGLARLGQIAMTPLRAVDPNLINSRQRPEASRPAPSELASTAYGQNGESPNQTGRINGAAELAQFTYAGYNGGRNGPLSIVPATIREGDRTTQAHLVSISGTEAVRGQSTGWATNLKSGFEQNNPGLRNARDAILRTVPEGSNLVLSGHSQGGMIAQQLAADPEIQRRYNVINTVTFGSPLIAPGQREGDVRRIAAAGDPVPRASAASVLPPTAGWAAAGQQNIRTDFPINLLDRSTYGRGIDAHMRDYTNENNPDLARMDALGRVNPQVPATIEFNPADRVFFTSPTHTSAPR